MSRSDSALKLLCLRWLLHQQKHQSMTDDIKYMDKSSSGPSSQFGRVQNQQTFILQTKIPSCLSSSLFVCQCKTSETASQNSAPEIAGEKERKHYLDAEPH